MACYGVYLLVSHLLEGEEPANGRPAPAYYRETIALGAKQAVAPVEPRQTVSFALLPRGNGLLSPAPLEGRLPGGR
jgi:hypothetical protein